MARMLYGLGALVRETGQALDRLGCSLQGSYAFREQCMCLCLCLCLYLLVCSSCWCLGVGWDGWLVGWLVGLVRGGGGGTRWSFVVLERCLHTCSSVCGGPSNGTHAYGGSLSEPGGGGGVWCHEICTTRAPAKKSSLVLNSKQNKTKPTHSLFYTHTHEKNKKKHTQCLATAPS